MTTPATLPFDPELVVFDYDDTQGACRIYYRWARARYTRLLADHFGPRVERDRLMERFVAYDGAAMRGPLAFSLERFPVSMTSFYEQLSAELGEPVNADVRARCRVIGERFWHAPYTPHAGVAELLGSMREAGYLLACCTKGDPEFQRRKLSRHGLDVIFHHVEAVPSKAAATYAALAAGLGVDSGRVLMVGDSKKDDVGPANSLGWATAWINEGYDPAFAHEQGTDGITPTITLARATDLARVAPLSHRLARLRSSSGPVLR